MAQNKIEVPIEVDDNGTLKETTKKANAAADSLDNASKKAKNYERNTKGAAQATSNGTKAFSKMAQGGGGIAGIYAQIAANVFAVSAAFMFLKDAADTTKLIKGQQALGAVTGVAYKSLTKDIQAATGAQIGYREAAQAAAIGTAAGLTAGQLTDLSKAARITSAALGRDLTDSFNRLVRGVTKAEPELLDELGIVLRLDTATRKYADAIGKTVGSLDAFERTQAVSNEVLSQTEEKFGKIAKIMDPSGEALNRFLTSFDTLLLSIKQGVTEFLTPVFKFLSNNTGALAVALAALSAVIVKSLIPDFGNFAKVSKIAGIGIKRDLITQTREIKKLELAYASLTDKAEKSALKSANAFKSLAASKGIEGSGTGRQGFDFLSGTSNSKASKKNAAKILESANAQFEKNGKIKVGLLKGFTEQELDIANKAHQKMLKLEQLKVQAVQNTHGKWSLSLKKWMAKSKLALNSFQGFVIKWAGKTAGALNKALAVAGWLGALYALYEILKSVGTAIYEYFNPVSDAAKEAESDIKSFTSSMQTLNEELRRTVKVSREVDLSAEELVVQLGNAAQSADIMNRALKIKDLSELAASGLITAGAYREAEKEFTRALGSLSDLDPALKSVYDTFVDTNKLDFKALNEFQKTTIKNGAAAKRFSREVQGVNSEITKLVGGIKKNPLDNLLSNVTTAKNTGITSDTAQREMIDKATERLRAEKEAYIEKQEGLFLPEQIQAIGEFDTKIQKLAKSREDLSKKTNFLIELEKQLLAVRTEYNRLLKENDTASKDSVTGLKIEYGITDKIYNLQKSSLTIRNAHRSAQAKQQLAMANLRAAEEKGDATAIRNANLALDQAKVSVFIEDQKAAYKEKQVQLQLRIMNIQKDHNIDEINAQETLMSLKQQQQQLVDKEASLQEKILKFKQQAIKLDAKNAMQQTKLNSEFGTHVFGAANKQEKSRIDVERKINAIKLEQVEADRTLALSKISLEKQQFTLAQDRLKMELAVLNEKRGNKNVNSDGLTPSQAKLFNSINSKANQAFSTQGNLIETAYLAATEAIKSSNTELDIAEKNLNLVTSLGNAAGQSLESGLGEALAGIIDGTKDVSDAFADMATNVLQSMSKILADRMAASTLDYLFPGKNPEGTTNTGVVEGAVSAIVGSTTAPKKAKATVGTTLMTTTGEEQLADVSVDMRSIFGDFTTSVSDLFSGDAPFLDGLSDVFNSGVDLFSSIFSGLFGGGSSGVGFFESIFGTGVAGAAVAGARYGGVLEGYSTGGIAKGSQKGFPAVLHGTEAVVPLPNGKEIPVQMQNGASGTNNVVVNVSVDNNGNAQTSTEAQSSQDAGKLGQMISQAVQKELQNQKRSGGILNPYGAS